MPSSTEMSPRTLPCRCDDCHAPGLVTRQVGAVQMTVAKAMAFLTAALLATPASAQTCDPKGKSLSEYMDCELLRVWMFNPYPTYKAQSESERVIPIKPVCRPGIDAVVPVDIPQRNPFLPPKQFDKSYNGTGALIIMRAAPEDIARHCNSERTALLGCAVGSRNRDHCTIYIADDEALKKYNQDYEIVYRHERGHCNGWSHGLGQ
jgi:hypothetical protein